jgi:GNAT superfamily N-acetyltransferase
MPTDPFKVVAAPGGRLTAGQLAQVEDIFFEASGRTFEPGPEREVFRERWLGRYLQGGTDVVLVALDRDGTVAGYLVGALQDPAGQERFADIAYFRAGFRELCRRFPAHLHINLAPAFRSQGLGGRLIEAFASHAAKAGAPGMHVVTGTAMRNVRFYVRSGFAVQGTTLWNGREVAFLGRALAAAA